MILNIARNTALYDIDMNKQSKYKNTVKIFGSSPSYATSLLYTGELDAIKEVYAPQIFGTVAPLVFENIVQDKIVSSYEYKSTFYLYNISTSTRINVTN